MNVISLKVSVIDVIMSLKMKKKILKYLLDYEGFKKDKIEGECNKCGTCCRWGKLKCPFLSKNNECRIHEIKPVWCKYTPQAMDRERLAITCPMRSKIKEK